MSKKRLFLTTAPIYLLFYMADAFLTSYYSLYFVERGMEEQSQSILLALIPLSLFLGCFALSPLAKSRRRALLLFRVCATIEAGLALGYSFCANFPSLLILTFLIAFFNGAPFPFLEGYVAPLAKEADVPYSTIRLFGTLGYVVALLFGFFFLNSFKIANCFYFSFGLFALAFLLTLFLPRPPKEEEKNEAKLVEKPAKTPFISRSFIFFLIAQVFLFGAFNSIGYFIPLHLKSLGGSDADYSLMRFAGVSAELLCLLLVPFLSKKFQNKKIPLLACALLCTASTGIVAFLTNAWASGLSFFILSGIGKAFFFAFDALFLIGIIGQEKLGRALVVSAGCTNLTSTLLNYASIPLYNAVSFPVYFGIMAGLEGLGILFLALAPNQKKEPTSEPVGPTAS